MPQTVIRYVFQFTLGRFGVVGIISTLIYMVIAMAGARWASLPPLLVNLLAYAIAGVWSYIGHYHITFRSDVAHRTSLARFFVLLGLGFGVSTSIVFINDRLGWPAELGTVIVSGFIPVVNFFVMQLWVFTSRRSRSVLTERQERIP